MKSAILVLAAAAALAPSAFAAPDAKPKLNQYASMDDW